MTMQKISERRDMISIPVNYRSFYLDDSRNPENKGWRRGDVEVILSCIKNNRMDMLDMNDSNLINDIGTFFEEGVCVKPDIYAAVFWFELAVKMDNDLSRSNLADILRKGSQGYPQNLQRAFELYKACGLPYAHYRTGECYEFGLGTQPDIAKARIFYTLALKEGHPLAKKKLEEWNYLCSSRFEVRCHEWGDDSDYHWDYYNSREEAQKAIDNYYKNNPGSSLYEQLYIIEVKAI